MTVLKVKFPGVRWLRTDTRVSNQQFKNYSEPVSFGVSSLNTDSYSEYMEHMLMFLSFSVWENVTGQIPQHVTAAACSSVPADKSLSFTLPIGPVT